MLDGVHSRPHTDIIPESNVRSIARGSIVLSGMISSGVQTYGLQLPVNDKC